MIVWLWKNIPNINYLNLPYYWKTIKHFFVKRNIESRAVNGTIMNRAYYSAYSYALLWLEEFCEFKLKRKWEYELNEEEYISEHLQVRNALKDYQKIKASKKLKDLHDLRKKADYKLFNPLSVKELKDSIKYMNDIFDELKF